MGGGWHAETYECDSLVYLEEVELKGAILTYAHLEGADLILADLQGAVLWNADLQEADLTGAYLEGVNLWDADLQGANLSRADFTRARFYHTVFSDPKTGQRAWAWADEPPVGLDRVDIQPCVFDEARNDRYTRPDPCIPPNPEDQR
ncbi:MAG TPA: pentapeptide repeat-containing protein [Aliiroseovarius sp.]|nr:pentapeptide repeat-containing protein [Aliiroseovarius sp.]